MPVAKDQIDAMRGKKVQIATHDFHHIVGALEGLRNGWLAIQVRGHSVLVDPAAVVTMTESDAEQAEFVK